MTKSNVFVGFLALLTLAGCGGTDGDTTDWTTGPATQPQGGISGTGGINGLEPGVYHAQVSALLAALSVPAADPNNAAAVNPALVTTGLLNTADGREVFKYAVGCALPQGSSLSYSTYAAYVGGGILSTTGAWTTGALTTSQKEDVLTCMIAHLNAVGAHVPIFLSGPSVTTFESSDDDGFGVEEAIWQAKIPVAGQPPVYYAWPRANLLNACGLLSGTNWIKRICGSTINTCGVQVRYDQNTACSGSNGVYTCNASPAIETTLQSGRLCDLYTSLL